MAGGNQAFGQTDVMHDRSYLISQLAHTNKRVREQAREALDNLNREEVLQQRDYALQQRDMAIDQRQLNFEATQRRIIAHQNALEMDKQLKMDRDTEIDEQGHGLLLSMMKLDAAKRRGQITKEQYDDGILNAASQFPMAMHHPEAKKHLEFVSQESKRHDEFIARKKIADDAKAAARLTGSVPAQAAERYARVKGTVQQYETELKGDISRQEKSNKGTPNVPYNPSFDPTAATIAANLEGAKTEARLIEKSFPALTGQVQQTQSSVNTPTPQPSPTPSQSVQQDESSLPWNIPGVPTTTPQSTPTAAPIATPSPSPEATAAQVSTTTLRYNPQTGEYE